MSNQHVKEIEDFYNKAEGSKRAPPPAEQKVRPESEEIVATSPERKDEVEDWDVEVAAEQKAKREFNIAEVKQESKEEDWDVEIASEGAKQQKVENGEADQESEEGDCDTEIAAEQKAERESEEVATTSTSTKQKVENGRESEEEDWDAESEVEREAEWESDLREMNNSIRNMLKQRIKERDENGTADRCMMSRSRSLFCICRHCLTRTKYAESTCRGLPRK